VSEIGWLASLMLVAGLWLMGDRKWWGFAFTVAGELIWVAVAISRGMYDLAAVCFVFAAVAGRNLLAWRAQDERRRTDPRPDDPG